MMQAESHWFVEAGVTGHDAVLHQARGAAHRESDIIHTLNS